MALGLGDMFGGISASGILNGVKMLMIGVLIIGVLGTLAWYIMYLRKYREYKIEVLDTDINGNAYKTYDRGGVFLDKKTGNRLLFLQKAKVGMDPNDPPFISAIDKKGRLIKIITVRKIGVNNYVYVKYNITDSGVKVTVGEEDTNNANQEMHKIRRTFDKKSWLDKFLAPIITIVAILIVAIILISLFNKFEVLEETSSNLVKVAELNQYTTELLLNLTGGGTIQPTPTGMIEPTGIINPV